MKLTTRKLKQMIREEFNRLSEEGGKTAGHIYLMAFRFYPQTDEELGHMEYRINLTEDEQYSSTVLNGRIVGDQEGSLMVRRLAEKKVGSTDFANWWHRKLKSDHPSWNVPQDLIMDMVEQEKYKIQFADQTSPERRKRAKQFVY